MDATWEGSRRQLVAALLMLVPQFVNDLHALISPPAKGTPLPLILLGKSKNAMLSTFLFLDQIVWAGRTGIYKNKERAEFLGRIAFYCFLGSNTCTTIIENEQYRMKLQKSNERLLALIDIVVAMGLLQLAPKKVTPRVTGAFGFASSLIACYQTEQEFHFFFVASLGSCFQAHQRRASEEFHFFFDAFLDGRAAAVGSGPTRGRR
ncbi:unnamed protein product [Miscanthus lutarioriparius]|uniref:Uncharacterized protein n=1 Tax=Miscanthus lutarioriparius TaxID=422564 RepID=A0A811SHG8_9POAL|nr:unnamed protein product [Miscanthus lutarioriparius]